MILAYFVWRFSTESTRLRARYANIIDIDTAVADAQRQLDEARRDQATHDAASARDIAPHEQQHQQRLHTQTRAATDALETLQRDHQTFPTQDARRRNALEMARLYAVLHCFENEIRNLIRETLQEKLGVDWAEKLPAKIKEYAILRQNTAFGDSWIEGEKSDLYPSG